MFHKGTILFYIARLFKNNLEEIGVILAVIVVHEKRETFHNL